METYTVEALVHLNVTLTVEARDEDHALDLVRRQLAAEHADAALIDVVAVEGAD